MTCTDDVLMLSQLMYDLVVEVQRKFNKNDLLSVAEKLLISVQLNAREMRPLPLP